MAKKSPSTETLALRPFVPYEEKKGESYMNDNQKTHFRHLLLNWRSELMEEVDRTVSHMKDEAANFPDPADRERKLIKKIDSTLELIENDDYGYCDACGVEIGIRRLEARPTATLCVDCKTLAEIKEKQVGN
jgi:DnaK suppressor protein